MNQTATTAPSPDFDLADFEDVPSAEVRLMRDGQPTPIFITMAGPEHEVRRKFLLDKQRRMRRELQRTNKVQLPDPADEIDDENELLSRCVLKWRTGDEPALFLGGERLECTPANVLRLVRDTKRAWVRRGLMKIFEDAESFIVASARG